MATYQVQLSNTRTVDREIAPDNYASVTVVDVAVPDIGFSTTLDLTTRPSLLAAIETRLRAFVATTTTENIEVEI